jgi:peptide/nickel transport system substrate-binding protein
MRIEKALATTNEAERNKLYYQLEQIVIDDAPLLPIYYSVNRRLIQPYVKNFDANAMEFRAFREVWLDKQ